MKTQFKEQQMNLMCSCIIASHLESRRLGVRCLLILYTYARVGGPGNHGRVAIDAPSVKLGTTPNVTSSPPHPNHTITVL